MKDINVAWEKINRNGHKSAKIKVESDFLRIRLYIALRGRKHCHFLERKCDVSNVSQNSNLYLKIVKTVSMTT